MSMLDIPCSIYVGYLCERHKNLDQWLPTTSSLSMSQSAPAVIPNREIIPIHTTILNFKIQILQLKTIKNNKSNVQDIS